MRGHPGAILDKLNFYSDAVFRKVVEEAAHLKATIVVSKVAQLEEWPLFDPPPPGVPASGLSLPERTETSARPASRDDEAWRKIAHLAKQVFRDPAIFVERVDAATLAPDRRETAGIANRLRTAPQSCGALKGGRRFRTWFADKARREAVAAVPRLRAEILAMRRRVNDERARLFAIDQTKRPSPIAPGTNVVPPAIGPSKFVESSALKGTATTEVSGTWARWSQHALDEFESSASVPDSPSEEQFVAAAAKEAEGLATAFAAGVEKAVGSNVDGKTLRQLAAMRAAIKANAEAFSSEADFADDHIPVDLIPSR